MKTKTAIICALIAIVAVLAIVAGVVLVLHHNSDDEVDPAVALQTAREAYRVYATKYSSTTYMSEYYLYVAAENCVVSIRNGQTQQVYSSREEAIAAIFENPDEVVAVDTGDGKLFACTIPPKTVEDDTLSVLMIGNSFSQDTIEYMGDIAKDLGMSDFIFANAHIGGCSLKMHADSIKAHKKNYCYDVNENGEWRKDGRMMVLEDVLQQRQWDYISIQQVSGLSGVSSTYNQDLEYLLSVLQALTPDATVIWNMTWAYQQDSTHPDFSRYGCDQKTMYNDILTAVQEKILVNDRIALVNPAGTAVQNARTSVMGDTFTRDGYHLHLKYGRFLAGLMMIKTITDKDINGLTPALAAKVGIAGKQMQIAIEAVNAAAETPFAVTESTYK